MTDGDRWLELRQRLEALPQDPVARTHPRNWMFRLKRAADFIRHARPQHARFFRKLNPYPAPFEHIRFRTEDKVQVAGWYGPPHPGVDRDFGIVFVPGMFATKDDNIHKGRVLRMWRQWKVPMLAIDLRAFGESTGIATAGWKESFDVHGAVKELAARTGLKRIGVVAESMGGAATLNAMAHDSRSGTDLMSGGSLLWSAFVDARDAVRYISTAPASGSPFTASFDSFTQLLKYRSMGGYRNFTEYLEDAARVNGMELDELLDLANPKWKVPMIHQPTLLVHATDDPVVPVRHARRMQRYSANHDHIQTLITTWGGHTGFEAMDRWWYWEVMRRFFGEVNGVDLPNVSGDMPPQRSSTRTTGHS